MTFLGFEQKCGSARHSAPWCSRGLSLLWYTWVGATDASRRATSHIGGCGRMSDPRGVALRRVPASSWNEVLIRRAAACGVRWPSWLSRDNTPRNASRLPLRCGRRVGGVWRETSFLQDQLGERVAVGQSVPWSRSDASNGSQSDRSAFCLVPTSSRVFRGRIGIGVGVGIAV